MSDVLGAAMRARAARRAAPASAGRVRAAYRARAGAGGDAVASSVLPSGSRTTGPPCVERGDALAERRAGACAAHGARRLGGAGRAPAAWRPDGVELVEDDARSRARELDALDGVLTGCALGDRRDRARSCSTAARARAAAR